MIGRVELSTYDWLRLQDADLRRRGACPEDRLRVTGHERRLAEPYLPSIGTWGACDIYELIDVEAPHRGDVPVSEAAFRRFKSRHGLFSRMQFAQMHGPEPWARAETCYLAYARAQRNFGDHGAEAPLGVACDYVCSRVSLLPRRRPLGLLPVEVVLWTRVFDALLGYHGIVLEDWLELTSDDKRIVWRLGDGRAPWSVEPFLRGTAVRYLPLNDRASVLATGTG